MDDARWDVFFTRNGLDPLTIFYEDLDRDPVSIVRAIAAHLDVDQEFVIRPEDVPVATQRTEMNEAWRALYLQEAGDADRIDSLDTRDRGSSNPEP